MTSKLLEYDAASVVDQGLGGTMDDDLLAICQCENRVLITLDLDFSDIRAYPPERHQGVIVLRPLVQSVPEIRNLMSKLITMLPKEPVDQRLWILEETRLRIRGGS